MTTQNARARTCIPRPIPTDTLTRVLRGPDAHRRGATGTQVGAIVATGDGMATGKGDRWPAGTLPVILAAGREPSITSVEGVRVLRASDVDEADRLWPVVWREGEAPPIAVLGATPGVEDRVRLLRRGYAACYGPDDPQALIATHAASIRWRFGLLGETTLEVPGLRLSWDRREVEIEGRLVPLRETPFRILHSLMSRPGSIVTVERLRTLLPRRPGSDSNSLRVHISELRRRLGSHGSRIQAERGVGYRLAACRGGGREGARPPSRRRSSMAA